MKNKKQNRVKTGSVALEDELKHFLSFVLAHKNLTADQQINGKIARPLPGRAVVFLVRIYYQKNTIYQRFWLDSAYTILCSWCATPSKSSAMLVPHEKIIGQAWFERRRKPGELFSKSGDGVCGFRDFGIAANLLQSLQRPSVVSRQSPGDDENNFSPTGNTGNQNAFRVLGTPMPVFLWAGFPLDGRINGQNAKNTLFQNDTIPFEKQLKSVPCLLP
ncbi:MAG TPA: hypothetical protein VGY56_03795 [Verrucomicrobiae bacterium]|nr:hypothetical protein [Verrucomicrobiae bacterium]